MHVLPAVQVELMWRVVVDACASSHALSSASDPLVYELEVSGALKLRRYSYIYFFVK
jgi:hypothetical protein